MARRAFVSFSALLMAAALAAIAIGQTWAQSSSGHALSPATQQSQSSQGTATQSNAGNPSSSQSTHTLRVSSNLVVVRVVVRDRQGKPVEGLQKDDFKLFDQGKEQTITLFEAESSTSTNPPAETAENRTAGQPDAAPAAPALPGRFLALYFDDLNTPEAEMAIARDAAERYVSSSLEPQDRVAIFTSGQMLTDFTSDQKQVHEALQKLHASSRAISQSTLNCPNLSDYQALVITQNPNNQSLDAWKVAIDEANQCTGATVAPPPAQAGGQGSPGSGGRSAPGAAGGPETGGSLGQQTATMQVLQVARNMVNQSELQARANLQQIDQIVKYIARMPGERSLILVSPGFLTASEQPRLDRLIDFAVRSEVIVSSLDPKGLATQMRAADASQRYLPPGDILVSSSVVDTTRELYATNVLAEVADGTGGKFFEGNNDLQAGFGALGVTPAYYILGYSPADARPNGKFHALKVTVGGNHAGLSVQARRGYFAPANETEAESEAKERETAAAENQRQEQIRETIFSKSDVDQFPVRLAVKGSGSQGETRNLLVSTHVDARPLQFDKDSGHNRNRLTFFFAIFDSKGTLVESQVREAKVDALDGQLPDLFKSGVNVNVTFNLKPGDYRVREVVTESEENKMAAVSRDIELPAHEKEVAALTVPWDPPDVDAALSSISATPPCLLTDVQKLAAKRSEELVKNLQNFDAHEQVRYEQSDTVGSPQMTVEANFAYAVDFEGQSEQFRVREYRTALAGTEAKLSGYVSDNGLPALALIFHPELEGDYDMQCEGVTQWNGRPAWVVYFHQIKGKAPRTAVIPTGAKVHPVSLKGRAWISTDTGQIMHLETNLVEGFAVIEVSSPNPVFVRSNSVSVDYAPVEFPSKDFELWLPKSAVSYTDYGNRRVIIRHSFSDFQLFSVQTHQEIEKPKTTKSPETP